MLESPGLVVVELRLEVHHAPGGSIIMSVLDSHYSVPLERLAVVVYSLSQ